MAVQDITRIDSDPGHPRWVEFLVRPRSCPPESPLSFIQRAYRTHGTLFDLGIAEECLSQVDLLPEDCRFSINIAPDTLYDGRFLDHLFARLEQRSIQSNRLILEIVEFSGAVDLRRATSQIERLRSAGVSLALDDFGPGFSNLDLVAADHIDFIKLDRSLLHDVHRSRSRFRLIVGLQQLARATGVALVAEGVECMEQLDLIRETGIEWIQGFLLGRPYFLMEETADARP
ncbi:EAL domain-containing protein [Wenzhouxiangella sp. XN79A]|uniref:EAL domain-containing protein n=1 Tax=Wenzhouxiangella sp. XN79A TaxID=2724193 RepID=UPI00144A7CF2|nr:EAL domain-containing protein [Wenzhouxiangella sp. XN79A]NKI34509.1 EAL domain-containing protein [Wenzhouxiangella sp. XN79A]